MTTLSAARARARIREVLSIAYRVFWLGDTITIRTQLAIASIGFAVLLWLHPDAFDRRGFQGMAYAFNQWTWTRAIGAVNCWGALFVLHGVGVFWRLRERDIWAVAINALGFFLWLVSTALINVSVGELTPSTALEMTVIVAAGVALLRTGLNDENDRP